MVLPAIAGRMAAGARSSATLVRRPDRNTLAEGRSSRFARREARFTQRRARFVGGRTQEGAKIAYRIDTPTMIFMICIAILFDLGQLASKVLYLVGLILVGAAAGQAVAGEAGAVAGAAGGAVATALGIGIGINIMLAEALSWALMVVGFFSIWLWFLIKGVPILGGNHMTKKFTAFTLSVIVEFVPILNTVPSITWWTWRMATLSRQEDRDSARAARQNTQRAVNDNAPATNDNAEIQYSYAA